MSACSIGDVTETGMHRYQTFMEGMSSSVPDWHVESACRTRPHWMFEVLTPDEDVSELSFMELWNWNNRNKTAAKSICATCPVRRQCAASAREDDTRWTMRAGVGPEAHMSEGLRRACAHLPKEAQKLCKKCIKSADEKLGTRLASEFDWM
jgi:hypothetical protein